MTTKSATTPYLLIALVLFTAIAAKEAAATDKYELADGRTVQTLDVFQDCSFCPEMIVLPAGGFVMGAPLEQSEAVFLLWNKPKPGEPIGWAHEGPEHRVEVDIPIAMGRNEVTREEWFACVSAAGCSHNPDPRIRRLDGGYILADDPLHPVMDVNYFDMLEYIAWLNSIVGDNSYRLPTEAEWEYAARAGTNTKFAQGDTLTLDQANIGLFREENGRSVLDPRSRKTPVKVDELDAANAWGLRHMAGNLLERTMSCSSERHLGLATTSAYLEAALSNENCNRVGKGGRYGASAEYARPANRGSGDLEIRSKRTGFRIVKELKRKD